jgi:hypothetical protein
MAKTLITTPIPTREDIMRTYGISPKRMQELDAMMQEIFAETDRLEARAKARRKRSRQSAGKGNVAARKKR